MVNNGTNAATVIASGAVNGAILNNAGTFNVAGNLTSNSTFTNNSTAGGGDGGGIDSIRGFNYRSIGPYESGLQIGGSRIAAIQRRRDSVAEQLAQRVVLAALN